MSRLTYAQAKMKVWNPETYKREEVREACIFILGTLDASQEDIDQTFEAGRFCDF